MWGFFLVLVFCGFFGLASLTGHNVLRLIPIVGCVSTSFLLLENISSCRSAAPSFTQSAVGRR